MTTPPEPRTDSATPLRWLAAIFFAALAMRWSYALVLFATMGIGGLQGPDSVGYSAMAQAFAANASAGAIDGWAWLGPDLGLMPLFLWLLSLHYYFFAEFAPLGFSLTQGVVDAATCLFISGMAGAISARCAVPAGLAAAANPTQIVLSGLVYTDTLFAFFVAMFLFASARWLRRPSWAYAWLVGCGLGGAALCRVLVVPWTPILIVMLLTICVLTSRLKLRDIGQLAVAGSIVAFCVSPIVLRNVSQYGAWALTPQGGAHLAFWVVPLVKEAKDGTLWSEGAKEMQTRRDARFGPDTGNPFDEARKLTTIGQEALRELGIAPMFKAWTLGVALNLGTPAIVISPPVFQLPRTGFFGTAGSTVIDKIANFLFRSDNRIYAWIMLLGLGGVFVVRLLQFAGIVALVRERSAWPILAVFGLWIGYILAINGPIASPKYRLPIEPVLMVMTGAGFVLVRDWWLQGREKARA